MGCSNQTCALTELPIRYGDKVRFALIAETGGCYPETPVYTCGAYQFWTPFFSASYDDYGSVEKITDPLWDWVWSKIAAGVKPIEGEEKKASPNPEDQFQNLIHQQQIYDPDRERRKKLIEEKKISWMCQDPERVWIWMCHEAAYQRLCDPKQMTPDLDKQLKKWPVSEVWEGGLSWVEGDQGALQPRMRWLYGKDAEGFADHREQLMKSITELCLFVRKLYDIRKAIRPMSNVGQQHDEMTNAIEWHKFIVELAHSKEQDDE